MSCTCELCDASYVVKPTWCKIGGARSAAQAMSYEPGYGVQSMCRKAMQYELCGAVSVVQAGRSL
eukprot:4874320-Pyramimonas_sp.AAC.1